MSLTSVLQTFSSLPSKLSTSSSYVTGRECFRTAVMDFSGEIKAISTHGRFYRVRYLVIHTRRTIVTLHQYITIGHVTWRCTITTNAVFYYTPILRVLSSMGCGGGLWSGRVGCWRLTCIAYSGRCSLCFSNKYVQFRINRGFRNTDCSSGRARTRFAVFRVNQNRKTRCHSAGSSSDKADQRPANRQLLIVTVQ